jgi:hypothetical protein
MNPKGVRLLPKPPVRADLNPGVSVMEPANQELRYDASDPLNRARRSVQTCVEA